METKKKVVFVMYLLCHLNTSHKQKTHRKEENNSLLIIGVCHTCIGLTVALVVEQVV